MLAALNQVNFHTGIPPRESSTVINCIKRHRCSSLAFDTQTQNIFLSSTNRSRDIMFISNANGNVPVSTIYFNDAVVVISKIGRGSTANVISHLAIAHCSMPNQGLSFRNDRSSMFSTFDGYCLVAIDVLRTRTESIAVAGRGPGAVIRNNHIHAGQTALGEAAGTTVGGDKNSLFAIFKTGNLTPQGVSLNNLKTPVVKLTEAITGMTTPALLGAKL